MGWELRLFKSPGAVCRSSHSHKTGEAVEPGRQKGKTDNCLCCFRTSNTLLFLSEPLYTKFRKAKAGVSYS